MPACWLGDQLRGSWLHDSTATASELQVHSGTQSVVAPGYAAEQCLRVAQGPGRTLSCIRASLVASELDHAKAARAQDADSLVLRVAQQEPIGCVLTACAIRGHARPEISSIRASVPSPAGIPAARAVFSPEGHPGLCTVS